nr:putative reverse transcriptase domain-containing protein [Tanacetum cinerariifolium]
MEVFLAKEIIFKLIQAWDKKQIELWSLPELLPQLLNDSRTIDEMLKQREQTANLAVQKEQEDSDGKFQVYLNPLFDDEEINSDKIDPHYFNVEFDLIESLSNRDTLFDSSPKFDYLEEFSGEFMPTSIVNEECIKREYEEYISLMEKLLTFNSFPRSLENFHANMIIETLPTSPIPIEYGDSLREEIDIFIGTDDLMPPGIESDDDDLEGDIHFLEELLSNDSIPFLKMRELIFVVMNNSDELNEDECFDPGGASSGERPDEAFYYSGFIESPCEKFGGSWVLTFCEMIFPTKIVIIRVFDVFSLEALYGRKCRLPVLWAEIRESSLIGPALVLNTTDKVILIKEKLKAARDRQKSYADKRRKPIEFEVGDRVLLKVPPWKGVVRFGKKGKLAPRYVGPFEIIERTGLVAYRLRLPEELSSVLDTFHVSNLKKCLVDANLHVPLNDIKVDVTHRFVEEPIEIIE